MSTRFVSILVFSALAASEVAAQVPVRVDAASVRSIEQAINVPGTVTSPRTATLSTAVAGVVDDVVVDQGRRVETGDLVLSLDAELAKLASERLRAQVRQREVAMADARRRFEEAEKVGPEKGIARTTIESLRAAVAVEQAALAAARAQVREQQALVARHALKAPFDGVVSQRFTELGEWVNPGDPLFELVATENLRFDFRMAQDYYDDLAENTPVSISLGTADEGFVTGRVDAIVPVKDPGTRTFLVRVLVDASALKTTPGTSVTGRFRLATGREGVAVSRDAVLRFPNGRVTVWVVEGINEAPVVRERIVKTGLEFGVQVEVTEGLRAGEIVVVRGNETLQDGQSVVILDADS